MKLSLNLHWVDRRDIFFDRFSSRLVLDVVGHTLARVYEDQWNLHGVKLNPKKLRSFGSCSSIEEGKEKVENVLRENGIIIEDQ